MYPRSGLHSWMQDAFQRDQFLIRYKDQVEVYWCDSPSPQLAHDGKNDLACSQPLMLRLSIGINHTQIFESKLFLIVWYMKDLCFVECKRLFWPPSQSENTKRFKWNHESWEVYSYDCRAIDLNLASLPTKNEFSRIAFFRCLSFDFEYCAGKRGFLLLSKRSQWLWLWMWWRANVNWAWFRQLGLMERLGSLNSLWGCRLISGMVCLFRNSLYSIIQNRYTIVNVSCKSDSKRWYFEDMENTVQHLFNKYNIIYCISILRNEWNYPKVKQQRFNCEYWIPIMYWYKDRMVERLTNSIT